MESLVLGEDDARLRAPNSLVACHSRLFIWAGLCQAPPPRPIAIPVGHASFSRLRLYPGLLPTAATSRCSASPDPTVPSPGHLLTYLYGLRQSAT